MVHEVHGIGICEGTVKQKVGDVEKDYVAIRYREGAMLYLPVDQMDRLTKYSGSDNPRLNKIGGKEFEKVKQKVRASVKKLAFSLNALYAERSKIKGFVYPPDTPEQKIFEDNFPFTPTADQEAAIKDVKDDMEKVSLWTDLSAATSVSENRSGFPRRFQGGYGRKAGGYSGAYHDSGKTAL